MCYYHDMDSEMQESIQKVLELVEENNKILRKMRRSIFLGRVFHALYWVIIIGVSIGAYYYVQPYLESVMKSLGGTDSTMEFFAKFPDLLKNFQK